jgi:hypothetical protein
VEQLNNVSKEAKQDVTDDQPGEELQPWETLSEQLYFALNEYRFGRIDFLELLKRWEEILHISSSTKA